MLVFFNRFLKVILPTLVTGGNHPGRGLFNLLPSAQTTCEHTQLPLYELTSCVRRGVVCSIPGACLWMTEQWATSRRDSTVIHNTDEDAIEPKPKKKNYKGKNTHEDSLEINQTLAAWGLNIQRMSDSPVRLSCLLAAVVCSVKASQEKKTPLNLLDLQRR